VNVDFPRILSLLVVVVCLTCPALLADCADFTNTPHLVYRYPTYNPGYELLLDGPIAYWGGSWSGAPPLRAFDISDPEEPVELWSQGADVEPAAITRLGNHLYLAGYSYSLAQGGMQVLDLTDRSTVAVSFFTERGIRGIDTDDHNLLYLAAKEEMVIVREEAGAIEVVGRVEAAGEMIDLCVHGQYVYAAGSVAGVHVIDVADPQHPVSVTVIPTGATVWQVHLHKNLLYVASGVQGLLIYDLTIPDKPVVFGQISGLGDVRGVKVSGSEAFVRTNAPDMVVLDISDPAQPQRLKSFALRNPSFGYGVQDEFLMTVSGGLNVYRHTGTAEIASLGSIESIDVPMCGVALQGSVAVVSEPGEWPDDGMLFFYDVSDLQVPVISGQVKISPRRHVFFKGDYVYAWDAYDDVPVIDASDPTAPLLLGSINVLPSGSLWRLSDFSIVAEFGYALAYRTTTDEGRLRSLRFSDPQHVVLTDELVLPFRPYKIVYEGSLAIATRNAGPGMTDVRLLIVDLTEGEQSILYDGIFAASEGIYAPTSMAVVNGYLYLSGDPSLATIDIRDPLAPVLCEVINAPMGILEACGSVLYLAAYGLGTYAYDISIPNHPRLLGGWNMERSARLIVADELKVICGDGLKLEVGSAACSDMAGIPPDIGPDEISDEFEAWATEFTVHTSPAGTTFYFSLRESLPARLTVVDVAGRSLWNRTIEHVTAGTYKLNWSGRDARGRDVPSGIYFAVLSQEHHRRSVSFVVIE
jgi:hypothetical protein